ncbi:unnamed protein product [Trifolium pratense]|uniref:Uncharacterized protein n=2 Tax=Trifolium pratense TaxID=57577 RepID=A0ACB0IWM4_TRIPR|nr:unnamed protein product [Trifolium pratense]
MELPPKKKQRQSTAPSPPIFIPDELVTEILSFLSVKTIAQFRCVNKSWKTLISDQNFTKMHLKKSSQNPHFILSIPGYPIYSVISLPVLRLLEDPFLTVVEGYTYHHLNIEICVVGSCNGLVCLLCGSVVRKRVKYWFRIWNPATKTISGKLGFFRNDSRLLGAFKFNFGFDYVTGTYKVVSFRVERDELKMNGVLWRYQVRIFNLGDNCWRNIQDFPLVPLSWNDGALLSGTVNWLALREDFVSIRVGGKLKIPISHVDQFVIVSLDLSTETYKEILLPSSGFDEVPCVEPSLRILMDCLCFSHDVKGTEFVIWQMKEFGVQESWSQLFRIEYFNLRMRNIPNYNELDFVGLMECDTPLLPMCVSKNGDTLILTKVADGRVIMYDRRDKGVEITTRVPKQICLFSAIDYVESLVSTPWKSEDIEAEAEAGEQEEEDEEEEGWYLSSSEDEDQLSDIDLEVDEWDDILSEDEDELSDI